jgi:hypothetical protein
MMNGKRVALMSVAAVVAAAILGTMSFGHHRDHMAIVVTTNVLAEVVYAVQCWEIDRGSYPATLQVLQGDPSDTWRHPRYLKRVSQDLKDGWGHPLVYQPFSANSGFGAVISLGKDGRLGGTGPDADLEFKFPTRK